MMTSDALDRLAADLLADLAETPDLTKALVAETGLVPGDLRRLSATAPRDLAVALVDFICASDDRLKGFCTRSGWPVERVSHARAALEAGEFGQI